MLGFLGSIFSGIISKLLGIFLDRSKDKTIEKQQQEIVDLKVEQIEDEAQEAKKAIIDVYEKEKEEVSDDLQARLDYIKGRNRD